MLHTHSFFPVAPDQILNFVTAPESDHSGKDNFTMMPDKLLLYPGTVPILTIRNPRLVVPSAHRAMRTIIKGGGRANLLVVTNQIWCRLLYDYFSANGIEPLVIDADDYMTSRDFVRGLCKRAGLNPEEAVFSWSQSTEDQKKQLPQAHVEIQSTLMNSGGMNPGRAAKNLDLEAEEKNWEEEFGTDANLIQDLIRLAMPHYDYLYGRRLVI